MKRWNYFFLLFVLMIVACSKPPKNSELIVIDLEANIDNFKRVDLSELATEVEYIPLETNQNCLISLIRNIDINREFIFISHYGECLLFDTKGKFISLIGKKGKCPGEYLYPGLVNIGENSLFISSYRDLLIYNKSGEFIEKVKNPVNFDNTPFNKNWIPLSDSLFICQIRNVMGQEENKAIIFNRYSDTVQLFPNHIKFNRIKNSSRTDDGRAEFYFFRNELFYKEYTDDTLFRLNNKKLMEPVFTFNLGKFKMPYQLRSLPSAEYMGKINDYIWIINHFETEHFFFFKFYFGSHYPFKTKKEYLIEGESRFGWAPVLGVYKKKTGEAFIVQPPEIDDSVNPNGIGNDWDGGLNFFPEARINDSTLLMSFLPYELKKFVRTVAFKNSTPKYPEKKKELERLAKSLNENDNPVLMLVKLKE